MRQGKRVTLHSTFQLCEVRFFFAFFNTDSITKYKWRHAKFVQVLPTFSQEFLGTFFSWQLRNLPVLSAQLNPFQEPYVNKTELETKHKMDHQRKTWIRNDDLLKCGVFFKLRFNFSFGSPWLKMEMTDTATYKFLLFQFPYKLGQGLWAVNSSLISLELFSLVRRFFSWITNMFLGSTGWQSKQAPERKMQIPICCMKNVVDWGQFKEIFLPSCSVLNYFYNRVIIMIIIIFHYDIIIIIL